MSFGCSKVSVRVNLARQRYQRVGLAKLFRGQSLSDDCILLETIYESGDPSGKQCQEGLLGGHGHCACTPCLPGDSKQASNDTVCLVEKKTKMIHSLKGDDY